MLIEHRSERSCREPDIREIPVMRRNMLRCAIPIFLAVLLFSPPAHANAMIPIIVAGWFGMFLALVPIILIESVVLTRVGAHIWESLLAMSAANLGSTLGGIPLAIVLEIVVATNTPIYNESWDPKCPSGKKLIRWNRL